MTAAAAVPDSAAEGVAAYLAERIGISVAGPRRTHVLRQIIDAMGRAGATTGDKYCTRLETDEHELDELVARVMVGESYFFREPGQLEVLRSTILPERRRARGRGAALRLWSAGCASGQEAYTLAIVLEEEGLAGSARIVASDISREALRVAATGVYGRWSLRAVTDRQREMYFRPVPMGYRIDQRFGRSIAFRQRNLLDPTDGGPRDIDVILCRNVLIYFSPEAVASAAQRLAEALAPGGWLATGSSDPVLDGVAGLEPTATAAGLMYRRPPLTARDRALARGRPVVTAGADGRSRPPPIVLTPTPSRAAVRPTRPADLPSAPEDETETVRLIRALSGAGDLHGALKVVAEAVARFPCHTELRFLQAIVLLEAGRPNDAAASARAALYLDPELVMAHLALARAEAMLGLEQAARRSLRNASVLLGRLPGDAPVPMSDGEPAGRLVAMAAALDRALAGGTRGREGQVV